MLVVFLYRLGCYYLSFSQRLFVWWVCGSVGVWVCGSIGCANVSSFPDTVTVKHGLIMGNFRTLLSSVPHGAFYLRTVFRVCSFPLMSPCVRSV